MITIRSIHNLASSPGMDVSSGEVVQRSTLFKTMSAVWIRVFFEENAGENQSLSSQFDSNR